MGRNQGCSIRPTMHSRLLCSLPSLPPQKEKSIQNINSAKATVTQQSECLRYAPQPDVQPWLPPPTPAPLRGVLSAFLHLPFFFPTLCLGIVPPAGNALLCTLLNTVVSSKLTQLCSCEFVLSLPSHVTSLTLHQSESSYFSPAMTGRMAAI